MSYEKRAEEIVKVYNEQKEEKIKLEERIAGILARAKKEFEVDSLDELVKLAEKVRTEIDSLVEEIEPLLESLEKSLDI